MKSDFQAGVDKIYNACKTYGSTPSASTPAACETSIKAIYDARYTSGYNAGVTAGKAACSHKGYYSVSVVLYAENSDTDSARAAGVTIKNPSGTQICSVMTSYAHHSTSSSGGFTLS
jgi:hypothetical protein